MPLLFSYGTLQLEEVQLSTFGRKLAGRTDELPGFEPSLIAIEDAEFVARTGRTHHANVTFTGRPGSAVPGTAFEISDDEFAGVDAYEAAFDYRRISARLASGRDAWVYVHVP